MAEQTDPVYRVEKAEERDWKSLMLLKGAHFSERKTSPDTLAL